MKTIRRYEIDWLRIILILSVFLFHIGMIFNMQDWHIKNPNHYKALDPIMSFLHYWRMPMLFFISGVGTYFAIGKRSFGSYIKERASRLMIPLIFGIFLLVPIQVYMEHINEYPSIWNFYLHMFDGIYPEGNFSWHHLWFLFYLFFCSIILIPFIRFYNSTKATKFKNHLTKMVQSKLGLYLFVLPILLSQIILRPIFPRESHAFFNDWAYITMFFSYFLYGFILLSNTTFVKEIYNKRHGMMIMSVLTTSLMFLSPKLFHGQSINTVWSVNSILLSWFLCLSIVGYAQKFLNIDNKFRKIGNEMIYPFYLLHQPIIIVLSYFVLKFDISDLSKFITILISSFIFTIACYFLVIRPSKMLRFIFGVKRIVPINIKGVELKQNNKPKLQQVS